MYNSEGKMTYETTLQRVVVAAKKSLLREVDSDLLRYGNVGRQHELQDGYN